MEYEIVRSKRRTLCIEVTRAGTVLVRAPYRVSKRKIERFVAQKQSWINKAIEQAKNRQYSIADIDEAELDHLTQLAKDYIPNRVAYYAEMMQVTPKCVKINRAATRFGSCSAKNSLNFSCRVMIYPHEIVDYVIVHELAHIKHHNHSADFYAFIANFMPDYKQRIRFLKKR